MADEWPRANDRNYCSTTPLLFAFFFFLIFAEREHLNRNVIYFLNKRTRATGRSTRTDYISAINRAVVRPPVLCGVYLLVFHFIPNHDHDCCKNAPSLYPFFLLNHLKKIWSMCCVLVWSDVRITNRARAHTHIASHRIASLFAYNLLRADEKIRQNESRCGCWTLVTTLVTKTSVTFHT